MAEKNAVVEICYSDIYQQMCIFLKKARACEAWLNVNAEAMKYCGFNTQEELSWQFRREIGRASCGERE